jgi:hypothetical protein
MRGKEEVAPEFLFNTYWSSYYANINLGNNYKHILNNLSFLRTSYIPSILEYSEYDFKNWQALESLEDALWESSHSSLAQEDYTDIKSNSILSSYYDKIQTQYNTNSRTHEGSKFKFKAKISSRSFLNYMPDAVGVPLYSEDAFSNPSLINLSNFIYFNNYASLDTLEAF